MQKLMRAAREGTKDGLEKTKAAVKKGRSFIRTKSFISQGMCQLHCLLFLSFLRKEVNGLADFCTES